MCESNNSEEMASFDALPPSAQNGTLESFDSSEFSLIPEQPAATSENDSVGLQAASPSHLQSALMSATCDLTEEEIHRRLVELAEDNRLLRESLQSSSVMMKCELSAIASWHNNITTTIAQNQISLQEANARIQELEREREQLLKRLNDKEEAKQNDEAEEPSLKYENTVLSDEDSEYEIIQKKSKDTEGMKLQLKEAELKIVTLLQEIEEQNLKIESMKNLFEENEKEKEALQSKLLNQDELNSKLSDVLKRASASEQTDKDLLAKVKQLEEQLQSRAPEISMSDDLLLSQADEYQERLNVSKERHEKVVKELEAKLAAMEESLDSQLKTNEAVRIKHQEDKKLLCVVQSNYDRVTKILQMQSRKEKQKTDSMDSERVVEAKRSMEQIDGLTARLFDLEQKLEESEGRVAELTRETGLLKEESESLPVLKAQVEVFKIDLDNAVLAKEATQEEMLQLAQQMKDLQAAQSTASFCSNCGAGSAHLEGSRGGRGRRRAHSHKQSDGGHPPRSDSELFVCPICQFGFTELQALENHVNNCLDKAQQ